MAHSERNVWLVTSSLLLLLAAYGLRDQLPFFGVLLIGSFVLSMVLFKYSEHYPMVVYHAGFIVLALGLGEFFLWQPSGPEGAYFEGEYNSNYFALDRELGYGLTRWKRSVRSIKKKKDGDETIYDVSYQINELGFRDVPHNGEKSPVFFFGDSFTFGEGVDDDDTLPAQFSKTTGRKVFNFGVHGYGPHQFLRMLEVVRLEELGIREKPALIIYTILPSHVDRAVGHAHWDKDGPLYELSSAGLVHRGSFQSQSRRFQRVINRSTIYQAVRARFLENDYRRRVLEILKRSHQLISSRYGVDLLVVIWDAALKQPSALEQARVAWLADSLPKSGVASFSVSQIAPAPRGPDYYISGDAHPKSRAYAAVAKAIAAHCSKGGCYKHD